jgi:hypothetical protein
VWRWTGVEAFAACYVRIEEEWHGLFRQEREVILSYEYVIMLEKE